jgi:hypothetical protein
MGLVMPMVLTVDSFEMISTGELEMLLKLSLKLFGLDKFRFDKMVVTTRSEGQNEKDFTIYHYGLKCVIFS